MPNKQGINPVTIRPAPGSPWANGPHVVIARMGINEHRLVQVLVSPPDVNESNAKEKLAAVQVAIIPEAQFINALGHLFPRGELNNCHLQGSGAADTAADPNPKSK